MTFLSTITGFPQRLWRFIQEAREELKKVSWPDRQTTTRYTIIVVIACLVVGFVIGGIDYLFTILIEKIIASNV